MAVALTFWRRLRGLRGSPAPGLLLWGRSVHGAGLRHPLAVLHLSREGRVRGSARLAPGGIVVFGLPGWLVELPVRTPLPAAGTRLVVRPILAGCPAG